MTDIREVQTEKLQRAIRSVADAALMARSALVGAASLAEDPDHVGDLEDIVTALDDWRKVSHNYVNALNETLERTP